MSVTIQEYKVMHWRKPEIRELVDNEEVYSRNVNNAPRLGVLQTA
jgi:hypothetical protein